MPHKNYWPENTEDTLYLEGGICNLNEVIESCKFHFGADVNFDDLQIKVEHIHIWSIGYDLYDASDYLNFMVITLKKN